MKPDGVFCQNEPFFHIPAIAPWKSLTITMKRALIKISDWFNLFENLLHPHLNPSLVSLRYSYLHSTTQFSIQRFFHERLSKLSDTNYAWISFSFSLYIKFSTRKVIFSLAITRSVWFILIVNFLCSSDCMQSRSKLFVDEAKLSVYFSSLSLADTLAS